MWIICLPCKHTDRKCVYIFFYYFTNTSLNEYCLKTRFPCIYFIQTLTITFFRYFAVHEKERKKKANCFSFKSWIPPCILPVLSFEIIWYTCTLLTWRFTGNVNRSLRFRYNNMSTACRTFWKLLKADGYAGKINIEVENWTLRAYIIIRLLSYIVQGVRRSVLQHPWRSPEGRTGGISVI